MGKLKDSYNLKPVEQKHDNNTKMENQDSLVDKVTWRHYSFFFIHFLEDISYALSLPVMDQYLYAKLAEEHIENTTLSVNSTFSHGGNSLCSVNKTSPVYLLQQKIQSEAATWGLYFSLTHGIPQAFMVLLLGSWTDILGRKPVIAYNMLGFAGRCIVYIAVMHWKLPTRYLMIGYFLEGISGGYFVNILLAFVYTADLTAKGRLRGTFLVIVGNLSYLFYGTVNFATGYFIRAFGFFWPTVCSFIFKIVLVILLLVFAKETVKTRGKWSDLKLGKSMRRVLKFYFKTDKYQNKYSRLKFILCITCFIALSQSLYGIWSIETLYQFNSPFCFDSIKRGRYVGIISIVQPIVSTIALKIFQLFLPDDIIAVTAVFTSIAQNIFVALASSEWMLYAAGLIGAPGLLSFAMIRTIVSQLSDATEQGSVFAGLGTVEAICGMTSSLMLNSIYAHTLLWMKGFVFVVVAICCIVPASLLLALHFVIKKEQKKQDELTVNSVEMESKDGTPNTLQSNKEDGMHDKVEEERKESKCGETSKGEHNLGYANKDE